MMTVADSSRRSLRDMSLAQFQAALASDAPAPGGGSASGVAGAMGAALVAMVARLTIGRQRYADVETQMIGVRDQAEALRHNLNDLADADAEAYEKVIAAYQMPREQEDQKTHRNAAIQKALRAAAEVPLEIATASVDVLGLASEAAALGNRNTRSDAAVGALLADAALAGAVRNVRSNLRLIKDEAFRAAADLRVNQLLTAGKAALKETLAAADAED